MVDDVPPAYCHASALAMLQVLTDPLWTGSANTDRLSNALHRVIYQKENVHTRFPQLPCPNVLSGILYDAMYKKNHRAVGSGLANTLNRPHTDRRESARKWCSSSKVGNIGWKAIAKNHPLMNGAAPSTRQNCYKPFPEDTGVPSYWETVRTIGPKSKVEEVFYNSPFDPRLVFKGLAVNPDGGDPGSSSPGRVNPLLNEPSSTSGLLENPAGGDPGSSCPGLVNPLLNEPSSTSGLLEQHLAQYRLYLKLMRQGETPRDNQTSCWQAAGTDVSDDVIRLLWISNDVGELQALLEKKVSCSPIRRPQPVPWRVRCRTVVTESFPDPALLQIPPEQQIQPISRQAPLEKQGRQTQARQAKAQNGDYERDDISAQNQSSGTTKVGTSRIAKHSASPSLHTQGYLSQKKTRSHILDTIKQEDPSNSCQNTVDQLPTVSLASRLPQSVENDCATRNHPQSSIQVYKSSVADGGSSTSSIPEGSAMSKVKANHQQSHTLKSNETKTTEPGHQERSVVTTADNALCSSGDDEKETSRSNDFQRASENVLTAVEGVSTVSSNCTSDGISLRPNNGKGWNLHGWKTNNRSAFPTTSPAKGTSWGCVLQAKSTSRATGIMNSNEKGFARPTMRSPPVATGVFSGAGDSTWSVSDLTSPTDLHVSIVDATPPSNAIDTNTKTTSAATAPIASSKLQSCAAESPAPHTQLPAMSSRSHVTPYMDRPPLTSTNPPLYQDPFSRPVSPVTYQSNLLELESRQHSVQQQSTQSVSGSWNSPQGSNHDGNALSLDGHQIGVHEGALLDQQLPVVPGYQSLQGHPQPLVQHPMPFNSQNQPPPLAYLLNQPPPLVAGYHNGNVAYPTPLYGSWMAPPPPRGPPAPRLPPTMRTRPVFNSMGMPCRQRSPPFSNPRGPPMPTKFPVPAMPTPTRSRVPSMPQ